MGIRSLDFLINYTKVSRFYTIFFILFIGFELNAQSLTWYFPWENTIDLLKEDRLRIIPLNLKGSSFRILRVKNIGKFSVESSSSTQNGIRLELFNIPINSDKSMDVIQPINKNQYFKNDAFFLVKLHGNSSGSFSVDLTIRTGNNLKSFNRIVNVSKEVFNLNLNTNVWAYLDYNFLVKGLSKPIINDLLAHKINMMIIPGYALPPINITNNTDLIALDSYLYKLGPNFKYYILYLSGYQDKPTTILSNEWKKNFPNWLYQVQKIFIKHGIHNNQILLYPFDEPMKQNLTLSYNFIKYLEEKNIKNKTFITLHNIGDEKLALKFDFVQVHMRKEELLQRIIKLGKNPDNLINYETKLPLGADSHPLFYLDLSLKASLYNLGGFGRWSYADSKRSDLREFHKGAGSWEFVKPNSKTDFYNSFIHRKGNKLYSTLRWEAFASGMDECFWLKRFENKFGKEKKDKIIQGLISRKLTFSEWEQTKILLNES